MANEYPECEKMSKVKDKSQTIGEFIEWIEWKKNWEICERRGREDSLFPVPFSTEKLLADFFGINLDKVEKEKRQMLDEIRSYDETNNR